MGAARNFKFGKRIDLGKSHLKHEKIPPKNGVVWASDQKLNFKPPSVNLKRVNIETSNLVYG